MVMLMWGARLHCCCCRPFACWTSNVSEQQLPKKKSADVLLKLNDGAMLKLLLLLLKLNDGVTPRCSGAVGEVGQPLHSKTREPVRGGGEIGRQPSVAPKDGAATTKARW